MSPTGDAQRQPTAEEMSARAYEIYMNGWDEGFSVEHLMAAEKELIEEYAQREGAVLESSITSGPKTCCGRP